MQRLAPHHLVAQCGVLHCSFRGLQVFPDWHARVDGVLYPRWGESLAPAGRSVTVIPEEPAIAFALVVRGLKKVRLTRWEDESAWEFTEDHPVLLPFSHWQRLTLVHPSAQDLDAIRETILSYPSDDDEMRQCAQWLATRARGSSVEDVIPIDLPAPISARLMEECAVRGVSVLPGDVSAERNPGVSALVINDDYVVAESFEFELTDGLPTIGPVIT